MQQDEFCVKESLLCVMEAFVVEGRSRVDASCEYRNLFSVTSYLVKVLGTSIASAQNCGNVSTVS